MTWRSITVRLIAGSALWIVCTLAITGGILAGLFRSHVEQAFDQSLNNHMEELLAFSNTGRQGQIIMERHPSDPQFVKPLSGWYWELRTGDGTVERSRSLWDQRLNISDSRLGERTAAFAATGPQGEPLRAIIRSFTLPEGSKPFVIVVAGPTREVEVAVLRFVGTLSLALVILGIGLIAVVVLQIRFGLWPLKHMRDVVVDIRAGRVSRMEGDFAPEIEPLAAELNALLDHNAEVIARARSQAGDLAHALKTPLAVLTNEADRIGGETGETIQQQNALMAAQINRHLSRARAAGSHGVLGVRSDVKAVADGLSRTLLRIYAERQIEIVMDVPDGTSFQGEHQDLEEMLGNLMDNACKWASGGIRVSAAKNGDDDVLQISVDDDGSGIPEGSLEDVLGRGRRLDETTPGSGLGLSIVRDIVELYGGTLQLGKSDIGGVCARLSLPAA